MTHTNHTHTSQLSGTVEPPALEACLPSADEAWALEQLRASMRPPMPVPQAALDLLTLAARGSSGGGQAARNFLFWLAGRPDPTGYVGNGGLELRRLDRVHKAAAMDVLAWWAGPTQSDQALYDAISTFGSNTQNRATRTPLEAAHPRMPTK